MKEFLSAYLFSFLFWSDLPLGAMALLMVIHLTPGNWGAFTRKILEALSGTIALTALLSIPIVAGIWEIYPWVNSTAPDIIHKRPYLNANAFIIRMMFYFITWLILDWQLRKLKSKKNLRAWSAGGLVWLGFSVTFAAIDWQMSVEPHWYSTIYGLVYQLGQGLTAFSFALVVAAIVSRRKGFAEVIPKKMLRDSGNILLAIVMVWAYLSFVQYLIVWQGNLPHEVTWFVHRMTKGWEWVALLILLVQFFLPFGSLLFRSTKDEVSRLATLCAIILAIRVVDHYWMLVPGFDYRPFEISIQAIVIWTAMGILWFLIFFRQLSKQPIFAVDDPDWTVPINGKIKGVES